MSRLIVELYLVFVLKLLRQHGSANSFSDVGISAPTYPVYFYMQPPQQSHHRRTFSLRFFKLISLSRLDSYTEPPIITFEPALLCENIR